jgi:hypothetical protein
MHYLLLIYTEEPAQAVPEEMMAEEMGAYVKYGEWLTAKGYFKGGEALQPTPTATTVRVRDGRTVTTDGPYAETKEQLGGYYLVDCPSLDEAIEAAARIPGAVHGAIEVRPIWDFTSQAPAEAAAATA